MLRGPIAFGVVPLSATGRRAAGLKIAIAAPEFGRVWGGIGTYLAQLLRGLGPEHEVTVLCGPVSSPPDLNVRAVPIIEGGGVMESYFRFQLALRRRWPALYREHRPDLLIAHHAQMPDLATAVRECPVVVTTHTTILGQSRGAAEALAHGSPLDGSERTTLAGLPALLPAELYYWSRVRHALFVSDAVRQEVTDAYAPRLRTSAYIPNGLSLETAPRPPATVDRVEFILFTGRLLGWKGLSILLQALTRLNRPERLLVTGSGRVDTWRAYARSLGLGPERVEFLGTVPRAELLGLLGAAKVVVVPSFMESCPYSLIEAMSFERPVVASAIPGIRDMVQDGVSAALVPPGDPQALAGALSRLLADDDLRRRLGRAAAEVARERFSVSRMRSETFRYLESVVASG